MDALARDEPPVVAGAMNLTDHDEIAEVLKSSAFAQAGLPKGVESFLKNSLFALHGQEHFERRRLESKLFGYEALRGYRETALQPSIRRCLEVLEWDASGVAHTDLVPLTWKMLHQISATVVGLDGVESESQTARFIELVQAIGSAVVVDWSKGSADDLIAQGLAARRALEEEFFRPSLERRMGLIAEVTEGARPMEGLPRDLITLLASHRQDHWQDELILHESTLFLVASIQTTSQAFPQFVLQLLDWKAKNPDRVSALVDPRFLRAASYESLRLFEAAPARMRLCVEDIELKSTGRRIEAGTVLALWFSPANRDRDVFGDDADTFNPDREVSERPPWGLVFGGGAHMCIGKPLVTGTLGEPRSGEEPVYGTMTTMAQALMSLDVAVEGEPQLKDGTYYFEYASIPIRLKGDPTAAVQAAAGDGHEMRDAG